jgi:hypothetical protein
MIERIPGRPQSRIIRAWAGRTVAIIAGGPSVTARQIATLKHMRRNELVRGVICVNDAYILFPEADALYFADKKWHDWHQYKPEFITFAGYKISIRSGDLSVDAPDIHYLAQNGVDGLSFDPEYLHTGRNSGFQALNLAVLAGAKRVVLLGFDGARAPDGRRHWFGDHPVNEPDSIYPVYVKSFSLAENDLKTAGVEVINCSMQSQINAFLKAPLESLLSAQIPALV